MHDPACWHRNRDTPPAPRQETLHAAARKGVDSGRPSHTVAVADFPASAADTEPTVTGPLDLRSGFGVPLTSRDQSAPSNSRDCGGGRVIDEGRLRIELQRQPPPRPRLLAISSVRRNSRTTAALPASPTTSVDTSSTVRSDLTLTNDDPFDPALAFAGAPFSESRSDYDCGVAPTLRSGKPTEVFADDTEDAEELAHAADKKPALETVAANATVTTFLSQGEDADAAEKNSNQDEISPRARLDVPEVSAQSSSSHAPRRVIVGDYRLGKTLGTGSMGKVKLATNLCTGERLAVKIIPRRTVSKNFSQLNSSIDCQAKEVRALREAAIMGLLRHPHIVSLREVISHPDRHYMFMEYVDGGHMLDYIISHGRLKERQAREFARQIGSALNYCHCNSIVHRDLKIENILITRSGTLKLTDFGLANLYSARSLLSTFCGSLYFAAPELLNARVYTGPEVDVWSFGVVLHILVCGKVPFDDQSLPALHAKIKRGIVEYPPWISPECKHLLSRMLVVNPLKRASMSEILMHPWMTNGLDGVLDTYIPLRRPITLPLDPAFVNEIAGFEFGDAEAVMAQLTEIVTSEEYQEYASARYQCQLAKSIAKRMSFGCTYELLPGLQHPLVSIYHLVRERENQQSFAISASAPSPVLTPSHNGLRHGTDILPTTPPDRNSSYQALSKSSRYPQTSAEALSQTVDAMAWRRVAAPESYSFQQAPQTFKMGDRAANSPLFQLSTSTGNAAGLSAVRSSTRLRSETASKTGGFFRGISTAFRNSIRPGGGHSDLARPVSHPVGHRGVSGKPGRRLVLRVVSLFAAKGGKDAANDDPDAQVEELNPSVEDVTIRMFPAPNAETADLCPAFPGAMSAPSVVHPTLPPKPPRGKSATTTFWREFSRRWSGHGHVNSTTESGAVRSALAPSPAAV